MEVIIAAVSSNLWLTFGSTCIFEKKKQYTEYMKRGGKYRFVSCGQLHFEVDLVVDSTFPFHLLENGLLSLLIS